MAGPFISGTVPVHKKGIQMWLLYPHSTSWAPTQVGKKKVSAPQSIRYTCLPSMAEVESRIEDIYPTSDLHTNRDSQNQARA